MNTKLLSAFLIATSFYVAKCADQASSVSEAASSQHQFSNDSIIQKAGKAFNSLAESAKPWLDKSSEYVAPVANTVSGYAQSAYTYAEPTIVSTQQVLAPYASSVSTTVAPYASSVATKVAPYVASAQNTMAPYMATAKSYVNPLWETMFPVAAQQSVAQSSTDVQLPEQDLKNQVDTTGTTTQAPAPQAANVPSNDQQEINGFRKMYENAYNATIFGYQGAGKYVIASTAAAVAMVTAYAIYAFSSNSLQSRVDTLIFNAQNNPNIVLTVLPEILSECSTEEMKLEVLQYVLSRVEITSEIAAMFNLNK